MESILKFQRDFFEKGISYLKPLVLKDIAEDIGMHESTISRVTTNKYAHAPRGIFELKYFFTSAIARKGGGDALHFPGSHLAHAPPQMVRLRPAQPRNLSRHAQNLLLEEQQQQSLEAEDVPLLDDVVAGGMNINDAPFDHQGKMDTEDGRIGLDDAQFAALLGDALRAPTGRPTAP